MPDSESSHPINFTNTEIAFKNKTDKELRKMAWLFKLMNNPSLVNIGSDLALLAVKFRLPFANTIIRSTIFDIFCGGENLLDCQKSIDDLYKFSALTILDYGAESKSDEEDLNEVVKEMIKAIELAAANNSVPVVSTKVTGLADNELLIKKQKGDSLTTQEERDFEKLRKRLDDICKKAHERGVGVFIDAEETWMQDTIDDLVMDLMKVYNKEKCIVFNTYQIYRSDKLQSLKDDYDIAQNEGFILGAKLVRGAYMEKERAKAEEEGYPSPIQPDKESTDRDFDEAIRFCIDHYETVSSCCASHNATSNMLQADLIAEKNLDRKHSHFNFCQLLGMSDYITFNLAKAGYNVAKYVPYGPVREVVPYLVRRARENSSVTGEMSRELSLINKELKRRGIS